MDDVDIERKIMIRFRILFIYLIQFFMYNFWKRRTVGNPPTQFEVNLLSISITNVLIFIKTTI